MPLLNNIQGQDYREAERVQESNELEKETMEKVSRPRIEKFKCRQYF